jgi:hypothetical protein
MPWNELCYRNRKSPSLWDAVPSLPDAGTGFYYPRNEAFASLCIVRPDPKAEEIFEMMS